MSKAAIRKGHIMQPYQRSQQRDITNTWERMIPLSFFQSFFVPPSHPHEPLVCTQPNSPLCVPTFFVEVKPIPDRHEVYLCRSICDGFITNIQLHFRNYLSKIQNPINIEIQDQFYIGLQLVIKGLINSHESISNSDAEQ